MRRLFLAACLAACGCTAKGDRAPDSKGPVKAELISEFDGVRVYRLSDAGHFVFVAVRPAGGQISIAAP